MNVSSLALRAQSRVVWSGETEGLEVEATGEPSWRFETSASLDGVSSSPAAASDVEVGLAPDGT